jgi:putative spermidine/putrescine transport system substrate-binding protein
VDAAAPGEGALHVLAADGIDLAGVVPDFEAATGCHVTLEPHGSSADIVRNATSTSTDVFAVSGDAVLALAVAGVAAPLPRGADDDVVTAVRRAGEQDGRRYGVPFAWGPEFILSARRSFPVPPSSYDALFDPAYAGAIAVPDDPFQIAVAAVVLGTRDPYALDARDLDAAAELIRRQRPLVREYWTAPADLGELFADGRTVLGQARAKVADDLSGAGVVASVPTGPVLAWSSWFVTAAAAPHRRCAAKWRNYVLAPNVQIALARAASGTPAVRAACLLEGAIPCAADHLDDETFLSSLRVARTPLQPTGIAAWEQAWSAARR